MTSALDEKLLACRLCLRHRMPCVPVWPQCLVAAADTAGSLEDIPFNTTVDALANATTAGSVEEVPEGP